jgi:peflin
VERSDSTSSGTARPLLTSSSTIDRPFSKLWGYLAAWRALFDRFDEDRSGTISYDEYSKALITFGYHLSPAFVMMMYRMCDKRGTNSMSFDIFVQSCISLKRLTDVFKKYDTDRDGYVTIGFEQFLTGKILDEKALWAC